MTGHNHYPDCTCGWCVGGWRGQSLRNQIARSQIGIRAKALLWPDQKTAEAYTVPNVACPVCGDKVFFHQAVNGGRVYFDSLGPPWPKHPCTDNRPAALPKTQGKRSINLGSEWVRRGWMIGRLITIYPGQPGFRLGIENLNGNFAFYVIVREKPSVEVGQVVFLYIDGESVELRWMKVVEGGEVIKYRADGNLKI